MTPAETQALIAAVSRLEAQQDNMADDLKEIKSLATRTNGRVTALEKSRERDKGFLAALALLMPIATAVVSAWLVTSLF